MTNTESEEKCSVQGEAVLDISYEIPTLLTVTGGSSLYILFVA